MYDYIRIINQKQAQLLQFFDNHQYNKAMNEWERKD